MLNLKKVIASVCVLAMVLSTVAFGATYTDVAEDSAYYEAVETLNKLDIVTGYEDGTYKPEDGVTRAEMAALIARIQGYGETAKGAANTAFTDVPSSHWASGYIANAAGMGIINGYGDGTFGPEDPVLYEQAVKMIMSTLGYTPFADKNGGYPTGYLAAAQRYDVSLAVANAAVGQEANRGTIAQLLANAIDTPLMVQSKWNTNGEVEYVIADGKSYDYKTLMSENLGYVKLKGIVTENSISMIGAGTKDIDTTKDAEVTIFVKDAYDTNNKTFLKYAATWDEDDKEYYYNAEKSFLVGDTDAEEFLGYQVIAYVKNVDGDFEIVSIAKDSTSNETLTIALDQYVGYNATKNELSYYKDGDNDTTEITVVSTFDAVVNGEGMDGYGFDANDDGEEDDEYWGAIPVIAANTLKGGEITFIDTDDVKGYDKAIVTIAATGVVKKVTEDGINFYNNVYLADNAGGKSIEIDVEDETAVFELSKDGEVIDFTELEEWDVISIYANAENSKVIKAEVIGTEVVGTITSTKKSETSADAQAYKIEDTWYDLAAGAYAINKDLVQVGDGGTFYVDKFGKIAAFDEDAALATGVAGTYGYVVKTGAPEADFGDGTSYELKAQVLTADGVETLKFKDKFDIKYADNTNAYANINVEEWTATDIIIADSVDKPLEKVNELILNKVVKFTKNSAGEISGVTVAKDGVDKFDIGLAASYDAPESREYDEENSRFVGASKIYVDSDAVVFIVSTDADKCKVGTLADFDDEGNYDLVGTYKTRKATDDDIIVVKANSFLTSTTSSIAVITEVGTSANKDGEGILSLGFMLNGEEVFADTTADVSITGENPGEDGIFDDQEDGDPDESADNLAYTAAKISVGDIVKIKIGSDGLVTAIAGIYDFADEDDVRKYDTLENSATVAKLYTRNDDDSEFFAGGVVKDYNENNSLATIGSGQYKLTQAKNIYVVDGSGKNLVIKNGSEANFKFFENLYPKNDDGDDISASQNVLVYDKTHSVPSSVKADVAQAYADHVYVRQYDEKVTDVVIVKGIDIKVNLAD